MGALLHEVLARTSVLSYAGQPSFLRPDFQRGVKQLPSPGPRAGRRARVTTE
jgi:hypothetical protein